MRTFPLLALSNLLALAALSAGAGTQTMTQNNRPRAREAGVRVGVLPAGALNAITDVAGVRVGHQTIIRGDNVRTGVTAVLPHGGNLFREKVPGAVFVGNGFGKLAGSTQVEELGEIETPILLTSTLSVPRVADALVEYMIGVLVQTNYGGVLTINGAPVGRELGQFYLKETLERAARPRAGVGAKDGGDA